MLLFMIHNDEASYASFDSIVVSTMFTPYIVIGIIVIVNQRGDIRLKTQLSSSSWHSCEKKIRERKKFDLIFFPPHFNYEGFFFSQCLSTRAGNKRAAQVENRLPFFAVHFSLLLFVTLTVHRQGIKIFNQKSNLRNFFSSLFHNPENLISTQRRTAAWSNMNIVRQPSSE